MKKILKNLCLFLALVFCFSACSSPRTLEDNSAQDRTEDANDVSVDDVFEQSETQHIIRELNQNLIIDADVMYPKQKLYSSYCVNFVSVSPEVGTALFFPDDTSNITISHEGAYGVFVDGGYALKTDNGNEFTNISSSITFSTSELQKHYEIEELLLRYAEANPEYTEISLGFMSREEAISICTNAIQNCGIALTPVVETCVGLEHDRIMSWQQELLNDESSYYNAFGKAMILSNLTQSDDSYYIVFSFSYDGIPIFSRNEPNIQFRDNTLPPSSVCAEMLITSDGIQHLNIYPAYAVNEINNTGSILSVEDAIKKLEETFNSVILTEKYTVSSIYLEYMPIESNNSTVLTPYWCFEYTSEYVGDDGNIYQSVPQAERYNAFTGNDLAYGG